jgi:hypothetical protein
MIWFSGAQSGLGAAEGMMPPPEEQSLMNRHTHWIESNARHRRLVMRLAE